MRFWELLKTQNLYCITFNIGGNYARRKRKYG
jgi:hypothetical protein